MPNPRIKPGAEMVAAEIARLRAVWRRAFFKEEIVVKAAISAQLDVLADGLDEAEVRETFGEDESLLTPALAAFRWLNGEMDAPKPSAAYANYWTAETR